MPEPLPQNPDESASRVGPGRPPVEHQFKPGQPSPNPGGRPKGLARKVREIMGDDDGDTVARFWQSCLTGVVQTVIPEHVIDEYDARTGTVTPRTIPERRHTEIVEMKDRIAVSKMLAERGWGKPPQFIPIEDADPLSFRDEEADAIAAEFDSRLGDLDAKRAERAAAEEPPAAAE